MITQEAVKHGDTLCLSIAAASIVAKMTRDRIMEATIGIIPATELPGTRATTFEHKAAINSRAGVFSYCAGLLNMMGRERRLSS